jgi:hypothetical protein
MTGDGDGRDGKCVLPTIPISSLSQLSCLPKFSLRFVRFDRQLGYNNLNERKFTNIETV